MHREEGLISIGEMAKLTKASVVSLRYYEKLGILIPAYISHDSGYRYYSLEQVQLVAIIKFYVDLDIPLKELAKFAGTDGIIDFQAFLELGSEIAAQKLNDLKRGLRLINDIKQQIDLASSYPVEQIYTRKFPKMSYYVKPLGASLQDIDPLEVAMEFASEAKKASLELLPHTKESYITDPKYGFLCEQASAKTIYYAFFEALKGMKGKRIKTIPAGMYLCRQSEESQIEQVPELFKEYLADKESYLAVEMEIFSGKHRIHAPLNEVRVLGLRHKT